MRRITTTRPGSCKEGGATAGHRTDDIAHRNTDTRVSRNVESTPTHHPLVSARGILFALAIAGGFYGAAYLASQFIAHPLTILFVLCIGVLAVMAGVRKEGAR
jgi:hypothetical protein